MLTFIPDPLPVIVISKNNAHGYAIAIDDDGAWNHRVWLVVIGETGEFWEIPNPEIRMHNNWTMKIGKAK